MSQINEKAPKINIALCTHRYMNPFFVNSMLYLIEFMSATGMRFEISSHVGVSNITAGRQDRIKEAMESDCTHILFVDDDMVFAKNLVHKMLDEMNKLTLQGISKIALGVNPCRKSPQGLYYTASLLEGQGFVKSKGQSGILEVSRCGLGVFLIEIDILRQIPLPHFEIPYAPRHSLYRQAEAMVDLLNDKDAPDFEARRDSILKEIEKSKMIKPEHLGEDYYFCDKLRQHGVRIFIDQDISQTIGHAGEFIYSYASYPGDKDGHDMQQEALA